MSGNLYQLCSPRNLEPGSYFAVNGPYDTHGYVVKSLSETLNTPDEFWYLVRGTTIIRQEKLAIGYNPEK